MRAKRVYVSVPRDHHLDPRQLALKQAILADLRERDLEPQEFHVSGLAVRAPYTYDAVRDIMSRCHGVLILALARWHDPSGTAGVAMPTVWNHFEGAFAVALKKEILVITEQHVAQDGITWSGGGQLIVSAPPDATPAWLSSPYAKPQFDAWVDAVHQTYDVFLAYSSKAKPSAIVIKDFLTSRAGVRVKDWELDFAPGATILEELSNASRTCLGAIALLTRDDNLLGEENYAAPRDNVIFEMGMFMEAKGRERVLVIREQGAKMPADIGGGIYVSLADRYDINPIHTRLLDFVSKRL